MPDPGSRDARDRVPRASAIRASDAERDATTSTLRDAASVGRLTFDELAHRLEAAGRALTRGDLAVLVSDLPAEDGGAGAVGPATGAAPAHPEITGRRSLAGDVHVGGPWRVPARSRFSTAFGDIELDLREAILTGGRVEIEVRARFGDVRLLVPRGVLVDVRARTLFGSVRQGAGGDAPAGAPVVVLVGGSWFGDVRIDPERLRERLVRRFLGR